MSIISPVQSHYRERSPMSKEVKLRWEGFVEKVGFEIFFYKFYDKFTTCPCVITER